MWCLRPRASDEFGFLRGLIYIPVVSKRSPRSRLFEWRVTRIQASPARFICCVEARDAKQAIQAAIRRSGLQRDRPAEQSAGAGGRPGSAAVAEKVVLYEQHPADPLSRHQAVS